jgi:ABC-2 type transport system permease protein
MFNYRIIGLLKRELQEKLLSKAFIIMTISIPLLMILIFGMQALIFSYSGDENTKLELITESSELTESFKSEFEELPFIKNNYYSFEYLTKSKQELKNYLEEKRAELVDERLTGIIFISDSAKGNKNVEYYSKTPKNSTVTQKLRGYINEVLVDNYFIGKDLSEDDLRFARSRIDFTEFKVTTDKDIEEEGYGGLILSYLFTFLLYLSLIMMGQMTMQSVMEEKNSRVVEVLLSSVNSKELMTGKIFGASITGVIQMAVWLIPVILVSSTTLFMLPKNLNFSITMWQFVYLLFNFFLGLITFLGLFAMIGSIFENAQEAQSGMWPVLMLIMIPFFIAISLVQNPANPIAVIASMFPFASIIVMPARMTIAEVPIWQFAISIVISIITIFAIFPVAGKIFRVGILRTGKKPKWSEVVKWLKYKY